MRRWAKVFVAVLYGAPPMDTQSEMFTDESQSASAGWTNLSQFCAGEGNAMKHVTFVKQIVEAEVVLWCQPV